MQSVFLAKNLDSPSYLRTALRLFKRLQRIGFVVYLNGIAWAPDSFAINRYEYMFDENVASDFRNPLGLQIPSDNAVVILTAVRL